MAATTVIERILTNGPMIECCLKLFGLYLVRVFEAREEEDLEVPSAEVVFG